MFIDKYNSKGKRSFFGSRTFYVVLALCIVSAGIGVYGVINTTVDMSYETPTDSNTRTEIDWNNYSNRNVTEDANAPVTGIPKNDTTLPSTEKSEETSQKPADNMPFTGSFSLPLGTDILKDYSNGEMVKNTTMDDWRIHNGIDFKGTSGEQVKAIQRGKIMNVSEDELWGTVVEIDHENGVIAKYCGITKGSVPKEGTEVERGQKIGTIADIPVEVADGYHLHLEITVNGDESDPLAVMNKLGN